VILVNAESSRVNRRYSLEAVDVVKPAGKLAASISENRRNYVTQAGFEEKLQRKIDEIKSIETKDAQSAFGAFPSEDGGNPASAEREVTVDQLSRIVNAESDPARIRQIAIKCANTRTPGARKQSRAVKSRVLTWTNYAHGGIPSTPKTCPT